MSEHELHVPDRVREFYDLVETDKFEKARAYFVANVSEITGWEVKHWADYITKHPGRQEHHIGYNHSFGKIK